MNKIQIVKYVKYGMEVYEVRGHVFMSEAGARNWLNRYLRGVK